jgi:hypothetical protein
MILKNHVPNRFLKLFLLSNKSNFDYIHKKIKNKIKIKNQRNPFGA